MRPVDVNKDNIYMETVLMKQDIMVLQVALVRSETKCFEIIVSFV